MRPILRKLITTETWGCKDGMARTFEVWVDPVRLIAIMGAKATRNKDHYSKIGHGAVMVKLIDQKLQEVK